MRKLVSLFLALVLVASCMPDSKEAGGGVEVVVASNWKKTDIENGVLRLRKGSGYHFPDGVLPITPKEYLVQYTEEELFSIKELEMMSFDLQSMDGLSMLKNLETAILSFNKINEIRLSEIPVSIVNLNLNGNLLTELPDLSALTNLEELNLTRNKIVDISSLEKLQWMVAITLDYNPVKDISVLLRMPNLKYVNALFVHDIDREMYNTVIKELRSKGVVVTPE